MKHLINKIKNENYGAKLLQFFSSKFYPSYDGVSLSTLNLTFQYIILSCAHYETFSKKLLAFAKNKIGICLDYDFFTCLQPYVNLKERPIVFK
jgi:hypothetical protein